MGKKQPPNDPVAEAIYFGRLHKFMTIKELADAVGASVGAVHAWERGDRYPRWPTMLKLMAVLDIPYEVLFRGISEKKEEAV